MKKTDEQLLFAIAQGNKKAFKELYQIYAPAIYRLVKRMLAGKSADCDEIFQEAMLRIWKKAALFDPAKGKAKAWIYLVATRHCLNWLNSKSCRNKSNEADYDLNNHESHGPGPEETTFNKEDSRRALELLACLPDEMQQVITLRHLENLSIDEIAQITQTPAGTVKSRIFYGLKKLRSFFFKENSYE